VTVVRPRLGASAHRALLLTVVGLGLVAVVVPLGLSGAPPVRAPGGSTTLTASPARGETFDNTAVASSIGELGPVPSGGEVGTPIAFAWQALDAGGARVPSFAVACELTVAMSSNGSSARAWVNASATLSLARSANGTFSVPALAWNLGLLNLTVSVGSAVPVTVRLFGALLPSLPAPVPLTVLPDLDHLVLYGPIYLNRTVPGVWTNDTFWHVRDRFGDPTPGAFLTVEYATANTTTKTLVPVTWATGGTTGAWVNYSAPETGNGTFWVTDGANSTLLGPTSTPALVSPTPPSSASLPPLVLAAVVLLAGGAVVGMMALVFGGRTRPTPGSADGEDELRRLAEGRERIVELVRQAGSLGLAEIEAAWKPAPAPAVLADWLASLVTDGTLTVTLGEGARAWFSLAERPAAEEPKVTFDETTLEREIARRDAAVGDEDESEAESARK
jgi:hypothetical protein